MGTSMTFGEVVALRKLLVGLTSDRASSAELIALAKDPYVLRVLRRLHAMEARAHALVRGTPPPGPLKVSQVMRDREPALVEVVDAQ